MASAARSPTSPCALARRAQKQLLPLLLTSLYVSAGSAAGSVGTITNSPSTSTMHGVCTAGSPFGCILGSRLGQREVFTARNPEARSRTRFEQSHGPATPSRQRVSRTRGGSTVLSATTFPVEFFTLEMCPYAQASFPPFRGTLQFDTQLVCHTDSASMRIHGYLLIRLS
eukprot:3950239-Pleurochrysis_carterae.AAC.2